MKKFNSNILLLTIIFSAIFLTACAGNKTNNQIDVVFLKPSTQADLTANTMSGAYLAGRFAQHNQDWQAASNFMRQVLEKDKDNYSLLHRGFLLALGNGEIENATELADRIIAAGQETELANLLIIANNIAKDDIEKASDYVDNLSKSQFNDYMRPVMQAWLTVMLGSDMAGKAFKTLKKQAKEYSGDPLYYLHLAMLAEYSGNNKEAKEFYDKTINSSDLTVNTVLAVTSYYYRIGEIELAKAIYNGVKEQARAYKYIKLEDIVDIFARSTKDPKEAIAVVLFELSTLLYERNAYDSALIYARLAEILAPESPFIKIIISDIYVARGNYDTAIAIYTKMEKYTGLLNFVRLQSAKILENSGQVNEAILLLKNAVEQDNTGSAIDTLVYLGDMYRKYKEYNQAINAYSDAIKRIGNNNPEYWYVVYARGISQERLNNWQAAEKDLLLALEVQPNNPEILNYLGYSWVDMGINIEKAIEMIKRAVMLKPDDGYIIDSYGWALYRLGSYEEAIKWLEYSAQILPYDMTINDHLGDAYWMVGRKNEAKFQWERAYSATNDKKDKLRIDKKIKFGLTIENTLPKEQEAMLH